MKNNFGLCIYVNIYSVLVPTRVMAREQARVRMRARVRVRVWDMIPIVKNTESLPVF